MEHLNKKVLELISEIQVAFKNDPEFAEELTRDLIRVSKALLLKELKKFDNGKLEIK